MHVYIYVKTQKIHGAPIKMNAAIGNHGSETEGMKTYIARRTPPVVTHTQNMEEIKGTLQSPSLDSSILV